MTVFSVFLGGGIGSVLRWLVTSRIASHWGVMLANVFGAMLIGMASEYFLSRADLRPEVRSFIVTGFLGGFTTFSTYLLDFNHLLSHEKWSEAGIYLAGSIVVGFAFLLAGSRLMKLFLSVSYTHLTLPTIA